MKFNKVLIFPMMNTLMPYFEILNYFKRNDAYCFCFAATANSRLVCLLGFQ